MAKEIKADFGLVVDGTSGAPELEAEWLKVAGEAFQIWKVRQKKYSKANISAFGEVGCLVRLHDKLARLRTALIDKQGIDADANDSVADGWLDSVNYSLMGLICHRGLWDK